VGGVQVGACVATAMTEHVQSCIAAAFSASFQQTLLPSFEASTQEMFVQINAAMEQVSCSGRVVRLLAFVLAN
jgi:hypothetical protein